MRRPGLIFVLLCLCLAPLAACGDDSDGEGDAGATPSGDGDGSDPGDGDGDSDGPSPSRPDASASGGDGDGDAPPVSAERCAMEIADDGECAQCLCDECPAQAADCDADCWRTVECIVQRCAGDGTDASCVAQRCSQDLAGAGPAMALGLCLQSCAPTCRLELGDEDAGI